MLTCFPLTCQVSLAFGLASLALQLRRTTSPGWYQGFSISHDLISTSRGGTEGEISVLVLLEAVCNSTIISGITDRYGCSINGASKY